MAEPAVLHVTNRSGGISVVAREGATLAVEGGTITVDDDGETQIRSADGSSKLVVTCAARTDLVIGTISGSVHVSGPAAEVRVSTVSGAITVEQATRVDLRTKSGTVKVGECAGDSHVVVKSSNVSIDRTVRAFLAGISGTITCDALADAEVKTVSGDVKLGTLAGGDVRVRTVSGHVDVAVPNDAIPETRLRSLSGTIDCECPVGDQGDVKVASVSGSITISCR
jgi:DUF4097 and DUF4098 domain-containing protein YvlB